MNRPRWIVAIGVITAMVTTSSALAKGKQVLQLNPKNMEFFYAKGQEEEFKGKKALHLKMTKEKLDGGVAFFKDVELADGIIPVQSREKPS